jgi:hypothetical protein
VVAGITHNGLLELVGDVKKIFLTIPFDRYACRHPLQGFSWVALALADLNFRQLKRLWGKFRSPAFRRKIGLGRLNLR